MKAVEETFSIGRPAVLCLGKSLLTLPHRSDPFRETRPFQAPYLSWNQLQLQLICGEEHDLTISIIGQADDSMSYGESDCRAGDADRTA